MASPAGGGNHARFVDGAIMRHIVVMTLTGAFGLMALFLVDFADLFFLSLLGDAAITAAIGFAGTVAFINLSISIGLGIAAAALVSQRVGARRTPAARRVSASSLSITLAMGATSGVMTFVFAPALLSVLGASGAAHAFGVSYLRILCAGFPLLAGAICCSFILRAIADARRAMFVTLTSAVINGILDPVLIFGLDLGVEGAAIASVCAGAASFAVGLLGLWQAHDFVEPPTLARMRGDAGAIAAIAAPAIATQLATPFAIAWVTRASAEFGDQAVAAVAIINRLVPVAFGVVFSLSGAVGPIIGQNLGAGSPERVRRTLVDALRFSTAYTLATSAILLALRDAIPQWFKAHQATADLVSFFCTWLAVSWAFAGAQFVAQAAFNNLGKAHWSTAFNWGKATVGTIPFVYVGARIGDAHGLLAGQAVGTVVFGLAATASAFALVRRL